MAASNGATPNNDIQAVVRAADILTLLTAGDRSTTVVEASRALNIQRTTMHRYLNTLEQVGLVEREQSGTRKSRFVLGPLAQQICTAVMADHTVIDLAAPRLQTLADQTRSTAVVCLWGRGHATVAHLAYPDTEPLTIRVEVGEQLELVGAQSRLFLAFRSDQEKMTGLIRSAPPSSRSELSREIELSRTERFAEETFSHGVRVVAVPVFDGRQIVATLGLVSTTDLLPPGQGSPQALLLRTSAEEIGRVLSRGPGVIRREESGPLTFS